MASPARGSRFSFFAFHIPGLLLFVKLQAPENWYGRFIRSRACFGICGGLACISGIGLVRSNGRESRYWSRSHTGSSYSQRKPRFSVILRLSLKSSWMNDDPYWVVGVRNGVVWAMELLSRAPNSRVAHPSPFNRVLGLMKVSAVIDFVNWKLKGAGFAAKTRKWRDSAPAFR